MDPLTHTLVGANLASTRLGERTRLAAAATVIGANLPDIDAILYFTGQQDLALGFRRGWTHGVLAIAVLPLILTGLLLLYDRLRPDPRRPVNARWLLILSFVSVLTHPALDWLNNYGMRWLMPFRGTWYYGDSVYIMDPWLWLVLGGGWLAGRRPTPRVVGGLAVIVALLVWFVAQRSAAYVGVVVAVGVVLFAALLWRPRHSFAGPALAAAFLYIAARLLIHAATVVDVRADIAEAAGVPVSRLMVSPHPLDPRRWEVVAQTGNVYLYGRYRWGSGGLQLADDRIPVPRDTPAWREARSDPSLRGFMTWVRFPAYDLEPRPNGKPIVRVYDVRYAVRQRTGFGTATATPR